MTDFLMKPKVDFAFKEIMMQVHPRTCIFLLNSNPLLTTRATRVILYL